MGEQLVLFKAINTESDQQLLMQKALSHHGAFSLQFKSDNFFEVKTLSVLSNNGILTIKCSRPEEPAPSFANTLCSASFMIGSERYLFETRPVVDDKFLSLPVLNLFHLQRRKNFRYAFPSDYSSKLSVIRSDAQENLVCRLLDLSTEGCAVEIPADSMYFNSGDKIQADILLGERGAIRVLGDIKNIRPAEGHFVLGVEFDHVPNMSEHKILVALTEFQREHFAKNAS